MEPLILDVRPYHQRKEEPFQAIMDAVETLEPGRALLLINSFEPTPLYRVMDRKGFDHSCECVGEEEYHVLFSQRVIS